MSSEWVGGPLATSPILAANAPLRCLTDNTLPLQLYIDIY